MPLTTVRDAFLALVCADADLLRAEFDAIIEAGWSDTPPTRTQRSARWPRPSTRPGRLYAVVSTPLIEPAAGWRWVRQRSPPGSANH